MAVVNHDKRTVGFKIVYCGTPLGGKTTNLIYIHEQLTPKVRGDLVSIATARNRTLFFDFLPVHATEIAGYQTKFQLYTVPGQEVFDETRQVVVTGVDGIVFVADSDPGRMEANLESLEATSVYNSMSCTFFRQTFLSAGGTQTGKILSSLPSSRQNFFDNDHSESRPRCALALCMALVARHARLRRLARVLTRSACVISPT